MPADASIASPLSVILDHPDVDEVLLTSFNSNLGFWERLGLGPTRGLGAAVTLVSDAGYVDADPLAVRQAGRTYLDGRAVVNSAVFHPKVTVLVSKKFSTLIVGSGNLTISGWLENAELWTVISATPDTGPVAIAGFVDWITRLPEHIVLSPGIGEAFARIVKILSRYHPTDDETQFIHNLTTPLIDQLPPGPVDDLVISSPFYDKSGTAVGRVLDRFQPAALTVAIQDTDVLDGAAVLATINRSGISTTIKRTVSNRYHHGKLIEWSRNGERFGLTGSPNISAPALLKAVQSGGNVEVGIVTRHPKPLEPPDAQVADSALLTGRRWAPRASTLRGPSLLSVIVDGGTHTVHLGRPLDDAGTLQFFSGTAWAPLGIAPAGTTSFTVAVTVPSATPVRLVDSGGRASGPVFVTSPTQVTRRRQRFTGRTRSSTDDVFRDAYAFELLVKDLLDLRAANPAREPTAPHHQPEIHPAQFETWRDYLDHLGSRVSPDILAYGLSIPDLGTGSTWDDDDHGIDPETDESNPDGGDDPKHPVGTPTAANLANIADRVRSRYKRGFGRLADQVPHLPPSVGITILRLILTAGSQHLWTDPVERLTVELQALDGILVATSTFQEEEDRIIAAGIVALTAAGKDLHRVEEELRLRYDTTGRRLAARGGDVSKRLINGFAAPLRSFFGSWLSDLSLQNVTAAFRNGVPGWIAYRLNESGHLARVVNGIVHVERAPDESVDGAAMRALAAFKATTAQVRSAHRGDYATYQWHKPHLLVRKNGVTAIYKLRGILASTPDDFVTSPLPDKLIIGRWEEDLPPGILGEYGFVTNHT